MKQKRLFALLLAAGLCLSLAACGSADTNDTIDEDDGRGDLITEPDNDPTGYTAEEQGQADFTPASLEQVSGTWSNEDGAVLQISGEGESYLYRTAEGRVGQGWVRDADGEAWLNFNRYQHLFQLSDDGNTITLQPLESELEDSPPDADTETMYYMTFTRDDSAYPDQWTLDELDGDWVGEDGSTISIDADNYTYEAQCAETGSTGDITEDEDGRGLYLYLNGHGFLIPDAERNTFTIQFVAADFQMPDGNYETTYSRA